MAKVIPRQVSQTKYRKLTREEWDRIMAIGPQTKATEPPKTTGEKWNLKNPDPGKVTKRNENGEVITEEKE